MFQAIITALMSSISRFTKKREGEAVEYLVGIFDRLLADDLAGEAFHLFQLRTALQE